MGGVLAETPRAGRQRLDHSSERQNALKRPPNFGTLPIYFAGRLANRNLNSRGINSALRRPGQGPPDGKFQPHSTAVPAEPGSESRGWQRREREAARSE